MLQIAIVDQTLRPQQAEIPNFGADEVLIRVAAAGVNRPDIMQRWGKYAPPPGASPIPGLEVAGEITQCGAAVQRFCPGDKVCALIAGGGYAEYCVAPEPQCLPIPSGLTLIEGAALPETFFTVWTNVFQRGQLRAGETILIHGGSSGIGTTAIQLAHAFGARVFVTAGIDAKCEACLQLGADAAINYRTSDFAVEVQRLTENGGVDLILDMVGATYFERNLKSLARNGRLIQIASLEGSRVELDLHMMMSRGLHLSGSTLRPRTVAEKGAIGRELESAVWPLLAQKRVRPVIYKTLPLTDAAAAHAIMESSDHIGKIVLVSGASGRIQRYPANSQGS